MRQFSVVIISLAVASTVAAGAYRLGRVSHARASEDQQSKSGAGRLDPEDGNEHLKQAIERIDRRLAAVEFHQMVAKPPEAQAPSATATANRAAVEPAEDPADEKEKVAQRAAAIDAALKAEQRDSAWASTTESQLQTAVEVAAKEGAQFSVRSVKCLTSICEMVLSASSPDQLQHTGLQLVRYIEGMGSFDIGLPKTASDGSATVTYRFFRAGYPRPDEGT